MDKNADLAFNISAISNQQITSNIRFSTQDEGSAKLTFFLFKDGLALPLNAVEGKLAMRMADGSIFRSNVVIVDKVNGVAEHSLTTEQLKHYGRVNAELYLNYQNNQKMSVHRFSFTIERALIDADISLLTEFYVDDFSNLKETINVIADETTATILAVGENVEEAKGKADETISLIEQNQVVNKQIFEENKLVTDEWLETTEEQIDEDTQKTALYFLQNAEKVRTRAILSAQGFNDLDDYATGKYRVLAVTDTESWKDITDNNNNPIYQISNSGEIRSIGARKKLKIMPDKGKLNVKLFGAKGDKSDETAILQPIFNLARDTGNTPHFPPTKDNCYGVSSLSIDYSEVVIDTKTYGFKSIKISGENKRNTVIQQVVATTDSVLKFIGKVGDRSHAGKITGLILEGVSILGNDDGGSGIYMRSFNDLIIRDCYIQSCGGDAIRIDRQVFDPANGKDEYAYNLKLENVKMLLNKGWGINSVAQHAVGSAIFDNCDIHGNGLGGININPSSITLIGGNIIGNKGPGLKVRQTPSYPTSVTFGLNVKATRFEGNSEPGGYEILVEGSWAPKFDGVVVLATTGAHVFGIGKNTTSTANMVRQPTIIGGYYAGNKTTAGQKFLDIGVYSYNLAVINPRVDLNEFANSITSQDMMDLVSDSGTDTYIIYGKNERTTRALAGKVLTGRALVTKLFGDATQRLLVRYNGALEWGDGTNNPDTNLYRSAAGQLRTDNEFVVGGAISPGATSAKIYGGVGSPEGSVTATNGSIYLRADGVNGTLVYVKTTGTGNMGWVAKW
ncbi:BppU family phage baseplate upper protein [Niallia taxi]|uniref:BppU family phage baseplate upper protein n=1 Tax=Niallia taxi TaxID=2499688 RepID=UPI003F647C1A